MGKGKDKYIVSIIHDSGREVWKGHTYADRKIEAIQSVVSNPGLTTILENVVSEVRIRATKVIEDYSN